MICLEHKRVEHAEEAHSGQHGAATDHESSGVHLAAPAQESEGHETCQLEPSLRERSIVVASNPDTSSRLALTFFLASLAEDSGHPQVSLLRLAPKQSPPA